MTSLYLLERFEHLANFSALMLAAARDDDWREVARLKQRAGIVIDEVRGRCATVALSAEERQVKLASVQRILANDGQIQALSQPWFRRVARCLPGNRPLSRHAAMRNVPPVERVGAVMPVLRRDRAHSPAAGDDPGGHDKPAGRDPHDGRRDPPPAAEAPATVPRSRFGRVVNTFAISP